MNEKHPDDIHQFDHNFRSPFYNDTAEIRLDNRIEYLQKKIIADHELMCEAFLESSPDIQADFFEVIASAIATDRTEEIKTTMMLMAECYAVTRAQEDLA